MTQSLYDMAVKFFANLQDSPEGREELARFDRKIQFEIRDGESFFIDVKKGKSTVKKGMVESSDPNVIQLVGDTKAMTSIFQGKARFAEVYTRYREKDYTGKLSPVRGVGGGTFGGTYLVWVGKLIRIGQGVR